MKAKDVILQLMATLPKNTDLFTEKVSITSIIPSVTTATAVTATPHGKNTGDVVNIEGTKNAMEITSITRVDDIATVVTPLPHDLTEGYYNDVEIINANEAQFNGTFELLEVLNRLTFTIRVDDSGATSATGSPLALDIDAYGYNGFHQITVVDPNTFTFDLQKATMQPSFGSGFMFFGHRITGAADIEQFENAYTKQLIDNHFACVVLGDVIASKDRHINSDSTHSRGTGQALLQKLQQSFAVYIFVPTKEEYAARKARDDMEDVCKFLMKSLVGVRFDTYLTASKEYMTSFVSHSFFKYTGPYYVHEFIFEQDAQHTYGDSVGEDFNVAFRDIYTKINIDYNLNNDLDDLDDLDDKINLDILY